MTSEPDAKIRLVVLFGGQSAEHDVSCTTAAHVLAAADPNRFVIEPIGITRDGAFVRANDAAQLLEARRAATLAAQSDSSPIQALEPVGLLELCF